jgi:signal transduction histidine kinase
VDKNGIHRQSGVVASLVLVITVGGAIAGIVLEGQAAHAAFSPGDLALTTAFLSLPAAGALLVWRRPVNAVGWLLGSAGVFGGLYLIAHGWAVYALRTPPGTRPGGAAAAWVVTWGLVPTFGVLPFVVAAFPTGRIERFRLRQFGRIAAVSLVVLALAQAVAPDHLDGVDRRLRPIPNPLGIDGLAGMVWAASFAAMVVVLAFTFFAIADAIVRFRRSSGDERRQLLVVVLFPAFIPASILVSLLVPDALVDPVIVGGQAAGLIGLSTALTVAVLRYRLYDLGDYVRRLAAYVALSAAVIIVLLVVASVAGVLLPSGGPGPAAIAAAAVALALGPLRARLQGTVDRLLFGDRSDPYKVLTEIGAKLESSVSPAAALTVIVDTMATSLRVPFVAIEADIGDAAGVSVRRGQPRGPETRLALVHQHEALGALVVGHRSADEAFTEREMQLLRDLARQVAIAVHAATVTAALQKARLDLVRSREEERRRLRRDIHDGIGPTLAGTMLQLDTLRGLIDRDDADAQALAAKVKANLMRMVEDVRRVSHDLRPPALDDLGLVGALREQVDSLTRGAGLDIEIDLATTGPLAAAAEVAIYRIASEALTNVVRHAGARHCLIRLSVAECIELEVRDDGRGVPDGSTAGFGLVSMRDRAAEIGGECTIRAADPAGTCVRARLPLSS